MFNRQNANKPPEQPERSPRVSHTPGAYPALSARPDPRTASAPISPAQAARELANNPPAATENTMSAPAPAAASQESANRLVVGPDVKLKGAEILDCDTLIVEGRVEATMDSRVIRIAEKGSFTGKVGIDVAEIHGHFEGELTARTQLIIHATGRVKGNIRYGSILIAAGGQISGDIQALAEQRSTEQRSSTGKEVDRHANITALISTAA